VALAFNLARGLDIDCGCFSSSVGPSTGENMILYLLRDAFLLAIGLFIFFYVLRRENAEAFPENEAEKTSM
jgi:hypothetical protein